MPTLLYHPTDLSWAPATPITAFSGSPSMLESLAISSASTIPPITPNNHSDIFAAQLEGLPDQQQPSLSLPQDVFSSVDLFDFSLPVDPTWHISLQLPAPSTRSTSPPPLSNTKLAHDNQTGVINETSSGAISTAISPKRHLNQQPSVSAAQSSTSKPYSRPTQVEKRGSHDSDSTEHMTSGQASLFQALLSLAGPEEKVTVSKPSSSAVVRASPQSRESAWQFPRSDETTDDESDEEVDPEGVEKALCIAPRMDGNVESNTLAFVLGCYARWFNLTMFDPLRIIGQARQNIIDQFSNSETDRTRIILVANAFHAMERTADLSSRGVSLVSVLRTGVHETIAQFNASQPSPLRELDIRYAQITLKNMLEVIVIHFYCSPLSVIFALMQHAAPVFRRACSEPLDQLPNLPSILLAPELPKRYFAAIDVGLSVLSARPMFFRYDVTYPRDFFNKTLPVDYGVEWLHGIPDRFVVIFAWINALGEDYGTNVDLDVIADIEDQITNAQLSVNCKDPSLRLRRMAVQECWRQASLIFLYLKLCGVNVKDPRVVQAFRKFMSIEGSIKSGRHPDAFMFIPMILSGVVACKKSDREKVQRRMLGTRECSISGIVGNGHVRVLQDLWMRMDKLQRVATWNDFRASNERVIGV